LVSAKAGFADRSPVFGRRAAENTEKKGANKYKAQININLIINLYNNNSLDQRCYCSEQAGQNHSPRPLALSHPPPPPSILRPPPPFPPPYVPCVQHKNTKKKKKTRRQGQMGKGSQTIAPREKEMALFSSESRWSKKPKTPGPTKKIGENNKNKRQLQRSQRRRVASFQFPRGAR